MSELEDAQRELAEAEFELQQARNEVVARTNAARQLTKTFNAATIAFAQDNRVAPTDAVREHIRAEQRLKQDIKDGKVGVHPDAPPRFRSLLDQSAYYSAHRGDGNDAARANMRLGFRRGWVDSQGNVRRPLSVNMQGRTIAR
jgi:hypothetical protein